MSQQTSSDASAEELRDDRESFGLQVAGGAHHLNNIYAQVLLNAELLDRSRLDEVGAGMLDSIVDGVHAAIKVVENLSSQSTKEPHEPAAVNLKYLIKGLQKRREVFFHEGLVINAQYPQVLRLAWARPSALFHGVMALCRQTAEAAPERQALFVQVEDVDHPDDGECVAIDVAAPATLVQDGLRAGDAPDRKELRDIVKAIDEAGGVCEIVESDTGGTLVRSRFRIPPEI